MILLELIKKWPCETPNEWIEAIRAARQKPSPFEVIDVTYDMFYNFTGAACEYFLKEPKPKFQIKKSRMIEIVNNRPDVRIRYGYNCNWASILVRNNRYLPIKVSLCPLYIGPLPFSDIVMKNMKLLFKYTQNALSREYYDQFINYNPAKGKGSSESSCGKKSRKSTLKKPKELRVQLPGPSTSLDTTLSLDSNSDDFIIHVEVHNEDNSSGEE